jgi:uncharacterized protein (TIGR02246 family)
MRSDLKLLFILLVLVFLIGCNPNDKEKSSLDINTITRISGERAKAFNEGDAAGIATHFTEDAYLMAPDFPTKRGQKAIQEYYQSIFDEYETKLESGYEDVKVDGDLAYGRGFAKVWLKPKSGGEEMYSESKYLNILERQSDGTWKTTHDIWNSNE